MDERDASAGKEMSDESETPSPSAEFPPPNFPTVYADGVMNVAHGSQVVKFYLSRFDPSFNVSNSASQNTPIAQVIMPLYSFIDTAVFFEQALNAMVAEGLITQEYVDALRGTARSISDKKGNKTPEGE